MKLIRDEFANWEPLEETDIISIPPVRMPDLEKFICPLCSMLNSIKDNVFSCECGFDATMNEQGNLILTEKFMHDLMDGKVKGLINDSDTR